MSVGMGTQGGRESGASREERGRVRKGGAGRRASGPSTLASCTAAATRYSPSYTYSRSPLGPALARQTRTGVPVSAERRSARLPPAQAWGLTCRDSWLPPYRSCPPSPVYQNTVVPSSASSLYPPDSTIA